MAVVFGIALSALKRSPDFRKIFKDGSLAGRMGLSYPRFALEHELGRYYDWGEAGFDEIFDAYEYKEVNLVGAVLEGLLQAALQQARIVAQPPRG